MRGAVTSLGCAGVAFAALAVTFACGPPRLPPPPLTGQPTSALVEVPYPPPPARVETIPKRPRDGDAVWLDGEWTWRTRRWAWKPGRWLKPPTGARFSPWTTVRNRMGTLFFAAGAWRDSSGAEVEEPEPLASSGPMPTTVMTPEGEEVKHAPNTPLDGGLLDGSSEAGPLDAGSLDGALPESDAGPVEL